MTTYLSICISNDAGDIFADGAATLPEVNAKIVEFAAKGNFRLVLLDAEPETIELRLSEEGTGEPSEPDESMDGDHETALASAGLGTDEDYRPGVDVDEAEADRWE